MHQTDEPNAFERASSASARARRLVRLAQQEVTEGQISTQAVEPAG